jgi:ABC-type transport system involved in cytochrome c biogenesis permease subunit
LECGAVAPRFARWKFAPWLTNLSHEFRKGFRSCNVCHLLLSRRRDRLAFRLFSVRLQIKHHEHADYDEQRTDPAGRPPVTNMYESIIWVSFAVSFSGMIFFARYRTTIYLLAALPVTLIALLLVHQMPIAMPSSIDPLVPVLRDNFWLTIHVLTITLSYAAFALAMGFGHILLWRYARDPAAARADAPMHFWLYRVLQLGVLLLTAGTILGGVWANYSWGRFWGWDPKETWALIALLCYILALHGRLAGWWTQFGLAVASVVCFLAVLMAWYGVNFVLGKGLHSYGFGIGGETYVAVFVIIDLLFVAFAVWRCRRSASAVAELHEIKAQRASV